MGKDQVLIELRDSIVADNICPDLAHQATQLVFGDGSANAQIVIVGEAPGKKEDEKGLPFVGASGKLLGELLQTIGYSRQDVYITNIVKYRPPNNRDPTKVEKQQFLPYLRRQLAIIAPKLIVTLGRHSTNCLLPGLKISEVHGLLQRQDNQAYLPMYHPAAAMYNGKLRQTLFADFAKIPTILQQVIA